MSTCSSCGVELPEGARFCPACGAAVEAAPAGEMLKLVTVLFADTVGSTARAEALHPEDVRALMADFFEAMSDEIRAEGGTLALRYFADRLEGRMGGDPDLLRRSAEGFASIGAAWEEAWSRLLLAELTGETADLGNAPETFERLGSVQEIERARALADAVPSA